jgi:hypothetical protein
MAPNQQPNNSRASQNSNQPQGTFSSFQGRGITLGSSLDPLFHGFQENESNNNVVRQKNSNNHDGELKMSDQQHMAANAQNKANFSQNANGNVDLQNQP